MKFVVNNSESDSSDNRCLLQSGWKWGKFGEHFDLKGGSQPPKSEFSDKPGPGRIRLLQIRDFSSDKFAVYIEDLPKWSKCEPSDILIARYGASIGRILTGMSGAYNVAMTKVLFDTEQFDRKWVFSFLRTQQFQQPLSLISRSAQNGFNKSDLAEIPLLIPPLVEQRRIVARLEALGARSRRARALLAEVPAQLAQARQSLLATAFRGTLTADWRSGNPSPTTADARSAEIRQIRQREWEQNIARRQREAGKISSDEKWKQRYKPAAEIPNEDRLNLPHGWACLSAEGCTWEVTVGYVGPMKSEYVPRGVPFLRSQNVRAGFYDSAALVFVTRSFHDKLQKSALAPGDVVIVRTGAPGTTCVIPPSLKEANCSDLVIARPLSSIVPEYLSWYINSPIAQEQVFDLQVGVAQQHFNVGAMSKLAVPVPSLPEQHEIVRRLTAAFARLDAAERAHAAAVADLDRLDQALLARAFSGTLVPPAPADEPAAATLARG